jgi:hypothetical protein
MTAQTTKAFDMDATFAKVFARRAAAGLVAKDGIACASLAEKTYRDFRYEMKQRPDWGNLPSDLHSRLVDLHSASRA